MTALGRFAMWSCLSAAAIGQPLKFEVATIKPAAPNDSVSGAMPSASPGRIEYRNMTLQLLIYQAYGTGLSAALSVSGGPDWINCDRTDKKLGAKVKPWGGTCVSGNAPRPEGDPAMSRCTGAFRPPGLVLEGVTMVPVAEMLSTQRRLLGRIVQDRTGLPGPYNIELEYDFQAANQPDYNGPSIFTALKEQLGLKLEALKGPLEVIVVESAKPPDEN